jgi:hypothetical protein
MTTNRSNSEISHAPRFALIGLFMLAGLYAPATNSWMPMPWAAKEIRRRFDATRRRDDPTVKRSAWRSEIACSSSSSSGPLAEAGHNVDSGKLLAMAVGS